MIQIMTIKIFPRGISFRYLFSAAICATLSNAIMIFGDFIGIQYAVLVAITWVATGTIAYLLHVNITFRAIVNWPGYVQFMAGAALGIPAALIFFFFLKSYLNFPMWISSPTVTIAMFIYNFFNAKLAIAWRLKKVGKPTSIQ